MTTYNGPATLVIDGVSVDGAAWLRVNNHGGPLSSWSGTFRANNGDLWDGFGKNGTLRLPNGSEGTVLVRAVGTANAGADQADLVGSGRPPF